MNFIFHNIWEFHHPNSRSHIFQRSWNHQSGFAARLIAATPEPGRKRGEDRWVSPDPDPSFVANGTLRTSSTPSQILGISPVGQSQGLRTAGSEWHHVASSFALYCRELPITSYHQRSCGDLAVLPSLMVDMSLNFPLKVDLISPRVGDLNTYYPHKKNIGSPLSYPHSHTFVDYFHWLPHIFHPWTDLAGFLSSPFHT